MEWSNDAVMLFLEFYQREPCIWDPQHPEHRNRKMVAEAWQRIHESFSLNFNCGLNELKKKKDSLMASFRMLLNKRKKCIEMGMNSDELIKPSWFAFEAMEKFLAPVYHCAPTETHYSIDTDTNQSNESGRSEWGDIKNENDDEEENNEVVSGVAEKDTPDLMPHQSAKIQNIVETISPPAKKLRTSKKKIIAVSVPEKEAFYLVKNDTTRPSKEPEKDECDLYGELLAKKLRKFDENQRDEIMLEIQTLLFRKRRELTQTVSIPTPSPSFMHFNSRSSSSSQSSSQSTIKTEPVDYNQYDA